MRRVFLNPHALVVTLFIMGALWLVSLAPLNIAFLNLLSETLADFEVSDVVMSRLRERREPDTSIALVNIARLPKQDIAAQIRNLSRFQPKAIGLDVFPLLENPSHPEHDTTFMTALRAAPNVVLASGLNGWNDERRRYDSLAQAPSKFAALAHSGFANLIMDENKPYRAVRKFSPAERVAGDGRETEELAFAVKLVGLCDSAAYKRLRERSNAVEAINYRGNIQGFYVLDAMDALDSTADLSVVRGKIVVMGYLGEDVSVASQAVEDRFFTPLNERYIGKADRDMYGAVIHANVVSMALRGDYINEMPPWLSAALAFVFCYGFVCALAYADKRFQRFYEIVSLLSQFVLGVLILFVTLFCFSQFRYDANLSLALLIVALAPNVTEIYLTFAPALLSRLRKRRAGGNER